MTQMFHVSIMFMFLGGKTDLRKEIDGLTTLVRWSIPYYNYWN